MGNSLTCPKCGELINIDKVLINQLKNEISKELQEKNIYKEKQLQKKILDFKQEKDNLLEDRKELQSTIDKEVNKEKIIFKKEIANKVRDEHNEYLSDLQKELNSKSEELKKFNKAKGEIEKLKREKSELKDEIEAESEKKLSVLINEQKQKIQKVEEEKSELKILEKNQLINQLKENLKDAQRKVEQGSMQMQGEVQEIAIENYLYENFKFDTINEIKKGARGADCIQIVNTREKQNCGSIYYESKRTKSFQLNWVEKFKNDIRVKGANIGVLVTDAMPVNMERMGQIDGIWVCSYTEFKGLCFVLRNSIIQVSNAISTQENKGEKMTMLYDFLTGNEFKLQIEGIVEGFSQMEIDLIKEKRSMEGHWRRREKQIQKVILNTNFMYNSIKGIAGDSIQTVEALEMSEVDENGTLTNPFDNNDDELFKGIDLG